MTTTLDDCITAAGVQLLQLVIFMLFQMEGEFRVDKARVIICVCLVNTLGNGYIDLIYFDKRKKKEINSFEHCRNIQHASQY